MQPDGYVKIATGRRTASSLAGRISSLEVEDALYRHPAVLGVAVVAQPDARWGEIRPAHSSSN